MRDEEAYLVIVCASALDGRLPLVYLLASLSESLGCRASWTCPRENELKREFDHYALSAPLPWTAPECSRATTVHIGGSLEEITESERNFHLRTGPSFFPANRRSLTRIELQLASIPPGPTATYLTEAQRLYRINRTSDRTFRSGFPRLHFSPIHFLARGA